MSVWLKWVVGVVIVGALGVLGYRFVVHRSADSGWPDFTLGINTWVGYGPFWLAQDLGYYEQQGVYVDISVIEDSAQRKAAILKGDVDGQGDLIDLLVPGRAEGIPAVAVMQIDESNGADGIIVTKDITTVADLKGKTIVAQKNFISENLLLYFLKKHGLTANDVTIVDTEAGAAGAAFAASKVDVAVTFEPWLSKAKERAGGHVLVSSADEPGAFVDILTVREQYLAQQPATVQAVIRAWFQALDYWKAHPTEANRLMAAHYNVTPEEFAELITGVTWHSYDENVAYFGTRAKPGKFLDVSKIFVDLYRETGRLNGTPPDMTKAFDPVPLAGLYGAQ